MPKGSDLLEHPGAEVDEEKAKAQRTRSDDEEGGQTLAPRHVARLDDPGVVVATTFLPRLPAEELHGQVVEQALEEVAVNVGAEADVDVEDTLDDAEEPIGHGSLGTEDHAKHAEDGGDARHDAIEAVVALDDPGDDGKRHDGDDQEDLKPVETPERQSQ